MIFQTPGVSFAKALGVSADAIKNFNEDATFNIISNTYHDHSSSVNYQFNFIEKSWSEMT